MKLAVYLSGMIALGTAGFADASTMSKHKFDSEILERDYVYDIYLPDGFKQEARHLYPVVYLLHGSLGDESHWSEHVGIQDILDELIDSKTVPPLIAVMPASQSWWVDGHNEPADTAFMQDFIPHIETRWPAIKERKGRIVGGLSAGGYGTVNFALKYPEKFGAALAFSPASYDGYPPKYSTAWTHPTFQKEEGGFDPSLWLDLNYHNYLEDYRSSGFVVPFYINSGDHDALEIAYHGAILDHTLRAHQPDHIEFRVVDGGHEWDVWRRTLPEALEFAFHHIQKSDPK